MDDLDKELVRDLNNDNDFRIKTLLGEKSLLKFEDVDYDKSYLWKESDLNDHKMTTKGEFLEKHFFRRKWLMFTTKIRNYMPNLDERRN